MSKPKVIVLSVVTQGLTKAEAARRYQVSWQWVHTLVTRYNQGGLEPVEPRSRRPLSNGRATPDRLRERIVELRKQLDADGFDAGPVSIAGQPAIVLIDTTTATVVHRTTGEVLSEHHIDPTRAYWRNKNREPGRWPGSQR
jgi:transposase